MKKIMMFLVAAVFATPVLAATVHLNSGASVDGTIVESSSDYVKVEVSGIPVTYYKDEITRIEGDDNAARTLGLAAAIPVVDQVSAEIPKDVVAPVEETIVNVPVEEEIVNVPVAEASASYGDKREMILEFVEVFGTKEAMRRNFDQMMGSLSAEQAIAFRSSFNIDDILEALVPLYDKHFTDTELKAFIAFYGSDAGRKLVETLPVIMKESVDVSAAYFEKNMPESLRNAKPEGDRKE